MKIPKIPFLLAALAAALDAHALVVAGSDLMKQVVGDEIKAIAAKNNIQADIKMEGSYAAIDAVSNGKADLAVIAVPRGTKLPADFVALPIAYQAALVAVNSVNPIEEISTKQLFEIYSMGATAHAETWEQVGVKNIGLRNIMPITTSLSDNVVVELFKYEAIDGTNLGSWVHVAKNAAEIGNLLRGNNSAIAVIGKFDGRDGNLIKILPVSKADKDSGKFYAFKPDRENIANGDYPLTLPFCIVYKKSNAEKIKALAKILLGDDIANKIDKSDFYSAPVNSRKKSIFNLDIPQQ